MRPKNKLEISPHKFVGGEEEISKIEGCQMIEIYVNQSKKKLKLKKKKLNHHEFVNDKESYIILCVG